MAKRHFMRFWILIAGMTLLLADGAFASDCRIEINPSWTSGGEKLEVYANGKIVKALSLYNEPSSKTALELRQIDGADCDVNLKQIDTAYVIYCGRFGSDEKSCLAEDRVEMIAALKKEGVGLSASAAVSRVISSEKNVASAGNPPSNIDQAKISSERIELVKKIGSALVAPMDDHDVQVKYDQLKAGALN
jgi:hypothetical protein